MDKLKPYSHVFLRVGLGVVFLLFGLQKLIFPQQGTSEIQQIFTSDALQWTMSLGMASAMNYYIGLAEVILGIFLFAGRMIPYAAPAGALLILGIFASIWFKYGLNAEDKTLLLDAGLIGAALALWALTTEKISAYAPIILRVGLALAFFLSGYQKIISGEIFIGFFVFALAAFLFTGRGLRYAAPACALYVAVSFGGAIMGRGILVGGILPDPTLSRDVGVIGAALALWAMGAKK